MLRLLPKEEQVRLRREYINRFSVLTCFALLIVLLLWGFSLLPTLVLLRGEIKVVEEQLRVAQDEKLTAENKILKNQLQELTHRLALLDSERAQFSPHIRTITSVQTRSITIQSMLFSVDVDEAGQSKIKIVLQGLAETRGTLAAFKDSLDSTGEFTSVELPLASFVRDTDVPFTITLVATPELKT